MTGPVGERDAKAWQEWCEEAELALGRTIEDIHAALAELGEPQPDYPAPVVNAVDILRSSLWRLGAS